MTIGIVGARAPCSSKSLFIFFFNNSATPQIYTLSLHDALPTPCHPSGSGGRADGGSPSVGASAKSCLVSARGLARDVGVGHTEPREHGDFQRLHGRGLLFACVVVTDEVAQMNHADRVVEHV